MFTEIFSGPKDMVHDTGYRKEYLIDSSADVSDLPTTGPGGVNAEGPRPGSTAFTPDGDVYILNNSRQWVEFLANGAAASAAASGSGSGGDG